MKQPHNDNITPLRKYIAIGYAVIALLIGGIVFIYLQEWRELERIEAESKEMNDFVSIGLCIENVVLLHIET